MLLKGKVAFITGASSGIGEAVATLFAEAGANLILVARRRERIEKLAQELSEKFGTNCFTVICDVRNLQRVKDSVSLIPEELKNIDILINNAGLARGFNSIQEGNIDDWEEMIDTNIKGLLYVSRTIIPQMVENNSGHIVNIGSIAGIDIYPNGNVYCATKSAVKTLSQAMAIDLNGKNIRVTNIAPGLVKTEFAEVRMHGDKERAEKVYESIEVLNAFDIADIVLFCVTRPQRVMIQDLLVTPLVQATTNFVARPK